MDIFLFLEKFFYKNNIIHKKIIELFINCR